jgi:RluA family pseudouridine synthase
VHRIDADTSGLVLCAKTKPALDFLSGQFQSKTVKKSYEAITVGLPPQDEFTVDLVLKEDEAKKGRMCVVKKHGKASVTDFTVRARFPQPAGRPGFAHLECRPQTGRTHQIRVHLAARGWPIVGDPVYGEPRWTRIDDPRLAASLRAFPRQALHAAQLSFVHPITGATTTIDAPIPADLASLLQTTGLRLEA